MTPLRNFWRSRLFRYGVAPLAVGLGVGIHLGLEAGVGGTLSPYIIFYPIVIAVAMLAGLGPGLLTSAAATAAVDYWLIHPRGGFRAESAMDLINLALFTVINAGLCVLVEWLRRARLKAAAFDREQVLSESRRRNEFLASVIQQSSQAFGVGYPDGRMGMVNRAFEELTGYTAQELQAVNWSTGLTPPERREAERRKLAELQATGQPVRYENELLRKDGRRVPIELLVHLARGDGGRPEYYYTFLTDITERKRAEAALLESERQLRSLADSIPNLAWRANADGYLTWYNQRWYEYTGATPEEMEGWGWQRVHDPQTLPAVLELWRTSIASGQPFEMTFPLRGADGVFRPFLTRGIPLKDARGRVQQWFGTNTDISDKERAEAAMRDLNAQLEQRVAELQTANQQVQASRRAALNLMDDAVQARKQAEAASAELRSALEQRRLALEAADLGAWDYHFQTGEVLWDERCREMWGMAQFDHVEYAAAVSRIHPEDREGVDAAVREALAGREGGAYHREFRIVWPDGSVHWIASHGHVYFQGEGDARHPVRFVGANAEITTEKQAQEALRESKERLAGFAAATFEGIVLSERGPRCGLQ